MSSDSSPNETSHAAQPGGQPDAPVHAFYLASAITARWLRYTLGGTSRGVDTLVAYPFIAIVVGGAFLGAWRWRGARSAAIAGLMWVMYGGYEFLIRARILCSGECNIRVDLLIIYPALLAVALVALWNTTRGGASRARRPDPTA
jgi:hypothetical protein